MLGITRMTEHPVEPASLSLAGKKLYSSRAIALYTTLANIPVGCVLYGLNLQARGSTLAGRAVVFVGIAGGIALSAVLLTERAGTRSLGVIGLFAAFCFYRFEREPVKAALQRGAELARWWPPALFVTGALVVLFIIACILP